MRTDAICQALERVSGVDVTVSDSGTRVDVRVSAIDDGVCLVASRVIRCQPIAAPNGDPAVEFVIAAEDRAQPLIIVSDDVVFAPASPRELLDSRMAYEVGNAPHLVAYSEMARDAEGLARACEQRDGTNLAQLAGTFLLLRCFIVGATRFDLRPVRSVAWWQRAWAAVGGDLALPPFRSDAQWEELVRSAERIGVPVVPPPPDRADSAAAIAALTPAEFRRTAPELTFSRLDDTFVTAWQTHIRTTPARFAETLLGGIDGARATVTLSPDGGGSIDVRVGPAGDAAAHFALMNLRFPAGGDELAIDEIRIAESNRHTGLFQQLMFRAQQVGELLGFRELTVHATDMGSYALAALWAYPKDPDLRHGGVANR
jgi:hypothetical protein